MKLETMCNTEGGAELLGQRKVPEVPECTCMILYCVLYVIVTLLK